MHFLNRCLYNLAAIIYDIKFFFKKKSYAHKIYISYINDEKIVYRNNLLCSISEKDDVRDVMRKFKIGPYKWFNTGGSSGNPLGFFLHAKRRFIERIHQYFVFKHLLNWNSEMIITLDGSKGDCVRNRNFPYGKVRIGNYTLRRDVNRLYAHIANFNNGFFLRGYPSQCIALLKDLVVANDFETINRINGLYLTSESVTKEELDKIFLFIPRERIILQYGMSETAAFAIYDFKIDCYKYSPFYSSISFQTYNDGYEILSDFDNGEYNFGTYRTSDYVSKIDMSMVWKRSGLILGRTTEYVINIEGEKIELTGLIFGAHHNFFNSIDKWQIVNKIPGRLEIHFLPELANKAKVEKDLLELFYPYHFSIQFIYDGRFIVSNNGKTHLVCR